MSRTPKPMAHISDILRLKHQHQLSVRRLPAVAGCPEYRCDYVQRAETAGLSALAEGSARANSMTCSGPDERTASLWCGRLPWPHVHAELRRPTSPSNCSAGNTPSPPQGYSYTRFCEFTKPGQHARTHAASGSRSRQRMFVDWAGQRCRSSSGRFGHRSVPFAPCSEPATKPMSRPSQSATGLLDRRHCHAYASYQGVAA